MRILQLTLLMLAMLLPSTSVLSAPPALPAPPETAFVTGHVLDAVGLFLPPVALARHKTWVVIKVTPDPFSGFAAPGGATYSGSYAVEQTLGAIVASRTGTYFWTASNGFSTSASIEGQPNPALSRWLDSGFFSAPTPGIHPQEADRTLLCFLHEDTGGQDKFTDIHVVPDGWQEDILPAVLYLRSHPQIYDLNMAKGNVAQARGLLHNFNPCLVLTALQVLASTKNLTIVDMDAALSSPDLKVMAASIVIAELYSWPKSAANAQWLKKRLATIKSLDQLEAVSFGVFTITPNILDIYLTSIANLPGTIKLPAMYGVDFGASLVPLVRQKLNELDPNGGASDERWRNIDAICRRSEVLNEHLSKPYPSPTAGGHL